VVSGVQASSSGDESSVVIFSQAIEMIEKSAALLYLKGLQLARGFGARPRVAIINGICHADLKPLAEYAADLVIQQQRRDECLALQRAGYAMTRNIRKGTFDLVLVLAYRQREQTMGWLAAGAKLLSDDGILALCAANDSGAKGFEKRLRALGNITVESKSKCRFSFISKHDFAHPDVLDAWLHAAAPRVVPELGLVSCPGVFSWQHADVGSQLLLDYLPSGLTGCGMDLGCGNGFLSQRSLSRQSDIRQWHIVDVDALALSCAQQNLKAFDGVHIYSHWLDASSEKLPGGMDVILMNPPFHKGHADAVALGQAMISAAARSLKPSGSLFLVANRHLPYELLIYQTFESVRSLFDGKGFKVMHCEGLK